MYYTFQGLNLPHDQKYWTGAGFAIGCVLTGTYHNVIVPLCKVKLLIIFNSVLSRIDENIIGAPKMVQSNYSFSNISIKYLTFLYCSL